MWPMIGEIREAGNQRHYTVFKFLLLKNECKAAER
jgi:hypothetical protein